jgi:hypothetical protein
MIIEKRFLRFLPMPPPATKGLKNAMKTLLFFTLAICSVHADAPAKISASEAIQHVGQNVTVEDVVVEVTIADRGSFVSFGARLPNDTLRVWIPNKPGLAADPEFIKVLLTLRGKKIDVTGFIGFAQERPTITMRDRSQLTILEQPDPQPLRKSTFPNGLL